jgi:hypothetical protein
MQISFESVKKSLGMFGLAGFLIII